MANITLTNNSVANGVYEGSAMALATTQAAVVVLVDDVTMTMTAAKPRWADNEANRYTVTITVAEGSAFELDTGDVITFETDAFDASVVIYEPSVQVTGNTPTAIAVNNGVLSLNLTEEIASGTPTVITFDVYRAGTEPTAP